MTTENQRSTAASDGRTTLVAEAYDRETESIIRTYSFDVNDIAGLCRALGVDSFEWRCCINPGLVGLTFTRNGWSAGSVNF